MTAALFFARRYEEALERSREILELYPNAWGAYLSIGLAEVGRGRYREAIEAFKKVGSLYNDKVNLGLLGALGHAYASSGNRAEAQRILDRLTAESQKRYVSPMILARIYVGLGDRERMFECLEKGYAQRDALMVWMKADPRFEAVYSDPRYTALLQKMRL